MQLATKIFIGVTAGILFAAAILHAPELVAGFKSGWSSRVMQNLTRADLIDRCGQPDTVEYRGRNERAYYKGAAGALVVLTWRDGRFVSAAPALPFTTDHQDPALDEFVANFERDGEYDAERLKFWLPCVAK